MKHLIYMCSKFYNGLPYTHLLRKRCVWNQIQHWSSLSSRIYIYFIQCFIYISIIDKIRDKSLAYKEFRKEYPLHAIVYLCCFLCIVVWRWQNWAVLMNFWVWICVSSCLFIVALSTISYQTSGPDCNKAVFIWHVSKTNFAAALWSYRSNV